MLISEKRLALNTIFAIYALAIERAGISLHLYYYSDIFFSIFGVPLTVITYWIVIGHTSCIVYEKFGFISGLLTGIIIDIPFEFLAFHLGWWTWIPSWSPAIFFNAPVMNFGIYLIMSLGSILTYKIINGGY
jgi:hypothetical protein